MMQKKAVMKDWKRGFDAGRVDMAKMIHKQLEIIEQGLIERDITWDAEESETQDEFFAAAYVIDDLRKTIKMYL